MRDMIPERAAAAGLAVLAMSFFASSASAHSRNIVLLEDIDSGTTSPQGHYRWMDVADQLYCAGYQYGFDYTQSTVEVSFSTGADTLTGTLTAFNLKPNFAYQLKLVGNPGTDANERIGYAGRWWQEQWNGSEWTNGQNLNNKGDGASPNPNDLTYLSRRDVADSTSPTGLKYKYTGYLVFDYFITDERGDAVLGFDANSSYHVIWKTTQRTHTSQDGPIKTRTFDVHLPDPVGAYDVDYPEQTVSLFGEWERLPAGGVIPAEGRYAGDFILTEESFHGSGLAGGWAAAMGGAVTFYIGSEPSPALSIWGLLLLFAALGAAALTLRHDESSMGSSM
jgi:hypothetical protein